MLASALQHVQSQPQVQSEFRGWRKIENKQTHKQEEEEEEGGTDEKVREEMPGMWVTVVRE